MRSPERKENGFTLTELLIALGIIVLLTLVGIPAIEPMLKGKSVDVGANMVQGALMQARCSAVAVGTEGVCWAVEGSVFESGTVTASAASGVASQTQINIMVDNSDGVSAYSEAGTWYDVTGQGYQKDGKARASNTAGCNATWSFTLPQGSGPLKVEAYIWGDANGATVVTYSVKVSDTTTQTVTSAHRNMTARWLDLGSNFAFIGGGTRTVKVTNTSNDGWVVADAVRITGSFATGCDGKTFADSTKTWTDDKWKSFYATWVSKTSSRSYTKIISSIKSNGGQVIADTDWSPYPEIGAPYLITPTNPTATAVQDFSIGSGTLSDVTWRTLPQGIIVYPYRINDDGSASTDKALPVAFAKTGRLAASSSYITIRIQDRENPLDTKQWRFIRVYRNTGRVFVARKLSELP